MRFETWTTLARIIRGLVIATCAVTVIVLGAGARAATLVDPSFFGQLNTTYQEWDGFSSPTSPNAATHMNNPYGTPDWFDTTAATDGAFFIGAPPAAHIYSFSGLLNLRATIPNPTLSTGSTTTIIFQAEVLGSPLDHSLFGINYAGLVGDPLLPAHLTEINEGSASSPFGNGGDFYYLVEWDNVPAAASYALTYSASGTSSSQVSARIDTLTTAPAVTLSGDVNGDGIVNSQDIAAVSSQWLQAGANLMGDANHDGIVNSQDIALISSNWLHSSGGTANASAVPEPSTLVLLGAGLLAMLAWRRRGW